MKIQTVYQNGVFKPIRPLCLKRRMVTITIPDEDIAEGAEAEHDSESREAIFRHRLEGIPFVSEKEMQEIEQAYGPPCRKDVARSEGLDFSVHFDERIL